MNALETMNYMNQLIDIYGCLLTPKQLGYLELYYKENLSLQEIADEYHVSKNAVHDSIHKARYLLDHYETKLALLKTTLARLNFIENNINDQEVKQGLLAFEIIK